MPFIIESTGGTHGTPDYEVRLGTERDVPTIARVHAERIREGFLSELGPVFLVRLFRRMARSPFCFSIVVSRGDTILAFATATENVSRLYRSFFLRDGLQAGIRSAPRLLRRVRKVAENIRYSLRGHRDIAEPLPLAEYLTIVVATEGKGLSLGRVLTRAVQEEFSRRGVPSVRITVAEILPRSSEVLHDCGFRTVGWTQVHRGMRSELLVWP